tara:strand:- start:1517 stop:1648 length:132 start_codon:yes stop_codon:yes gene_type:complete
MIDNQGKIKIGVIDDHQLFRQGLNHYDKLLVRSIYLDDRKGGL